jgi:hypothetical protein
MTRKELPCLRHLTISQRIALSHGWGYAWNLPASWRLRIVIDLVDAIRHNRQPVAPFFMHMQPATLKNRK